MRGLRPMSPKTTIHTVRGEFFLRSSRYRSERKPATNGSAQHDNDIQPVCCDVIIMILRP